MMQGLGHHDMTVLFLALGALLAAARILGEIARKLQQPAVIGEIIAGIILGPTILGTLAPGLSAFIFPAQGAVKVTLDGFTTIAIALFLLVAGMEVDLSMAWRQGKATLIVATTGFLLPFAFGFGSAWCLSGWLEQGSPQEPLVFWLFFATAMSISALPVIARVLMDFNLYRTDLGMIIIGSAVLNDLAGWNIFSVILGMMDSRPGGGHSAAQTILLTLVFTVLMLSLGKRSFDRALPWLQAHASWPGGVLGFVLALALFSAAITEAIGVHAVFGAFLFGVAVGDSRHLRQRTRSTIEQFVSFIFAPIFFASAGLKVNFFTHFDPLLVLFVLVLATIAKVLGCGLGARLSGLPPREAWAIGFGMNARGGIGIILSLLALDNGLIQEPMFVALVVTALLTSLTSGSLMRWVLQLRKALRFTDFLSPVRFVPALSSQERKAALRELSVAAVRGTSLDPSTVGDRVWEREQIMSTGLEKGLAIPHARLPDLKVPIVAVGISEDGVDFDTFDGQPTRLIFLILTPVHDNSAQLEILADISRTFQDSILIEAAIQAGNYTEFLALIRSQSPTGVEVSR
jgi:Kef-type K+ transport system membrane component KefB/mannitol/fructose-specific phosphotransferase system IIA component